eukprot:scaffold2497_cov119-Isochrysis_galbana.AAC.2
MVFTPVEAASLDTKGTASGLSPWAVPPAMGLRMWPRLPTAGNNQIRAPSRFRRRVLTLSH